MILEMSKLRIVLAIGIMVTLINTSLCDKRLNRQKRFIELANDVRGPYCETKPGGPCCPGRDDQCTVPILDSICYCDMFCNITASDCCPDFQRICIGGNPEPITHWTTVFVACPGNGKSVWDAWNAYAGVTCATSTCSVVEDADTCKQSHQSDSIINEWRSSHIEQVRLRLWKDGEIVVQMTFNGTDTYKFNWFTQRRLLASTYSYDTYEGGHDTQFTFFSSNGYHGYGVNRRFYINKINYSGCEKDAGWMFVKDVGPRTDCLFDSYRKYPYFLYATNDHGGVWQTEGDYDFADMMSIQVLQGKDVEQEVTTTTTSPEELWVPI